jgi:hypothetical protein
MRRQTHRRLILVAQLLLVSGLGLAATWNVSSMLFPLPDPGWWGMALALPGLILWSAALAAPRLLAVAADGDVETYRLVYDAPEGWRDEVARASLLALAGSAGLAITWARDGTGTALRTGPLSGTGPFTGTGCWLSVPAGWGDVLRRLVGDVFPGGQVEADEPPAPGAGVVILRWQEEAPAPADLCRLDGVEGVYYRWRDQGTATVALWGSGAEGVGWRFARPGDRSPAAGDLLPGQGEALRRPPFTGDNPWPGLPPFPPSQADPGLAAVSHMERLAPTLRVSSPALVAGQDAEGAPVGFALPDLAGMKTFWIVGQAAEKAAVSLAAQAVQAGTATFFLDGQGAAASLLTRRLLRETAAGRVLVCDGERPAQTRFRLNPLWLPAATETWPRVLPAWLDWLRELGVTPAGLGQAAYRHTRVAVVLAALVAAGQRVALDLPGLRSALDMADFLPLVEAETLAHDPRRLLGDETWDWWLAEGRGAPNFDVHLRLGHLRDRLSALLALPEYGVLWQMPYLDPLAALADGVTGLIWRLPDPRRRLRAYVTSQFLALATLLAAWPSSRPALIVLHGQEAYAWAARLANFPAARLVCAARRATALPAGLPPTTLLASRLEKEDAATLQARFFPGVRAADLRRLPERRHLFWRDGIFGTLDGLE